MRQNDVDVLQQTRSALQRMRERPPGLEEFPPVGPFPDLVARPMRSLDRTAARQYPASAPPPAPLSVIALNRMGYGPRPDDLAAFAALGADDDSRLSAYVEQQLHPETIDDSVCDAQIAANGYTTLHKTRQQLWEEHHRSDIWGVRTLPIRETIGLKFIRAIYSRRQLLEVLADFWYDHFNVYGWDGPGFSMLMHYDRDVLRSHALGNFREMVEAVAKSTCMLYYLDNVWNSVDGPNENFARELLELHSLGAEHYLGTIPQNEVPGFPDAPIGYVEEDVFNVAHCLTGWSVSNQWWNPEVGSTGLFFYRDDWHDAGQKLVLGRTIPAGQPPLKDGRDVLDLVAAHSGTARFIARKLCRRLVSDTPPESLVESAAGVFTAGYSAPDQLKQVVRHILLSPEFRSVWGEKIKRPFGAVVSALRAIDADFSLPPSDDWFDNPASWFYWMYGQAGHLPFEWPTPDGYPDEKEVWQNSSSLLMRWRTMNWLPNAREEGNLIFSDVVAQTPAGIRSANALVDYWIDRVFGYAISDQSRSALVQYMAQGHNPAYDLPLDSDEDVQSRLRGLVGIMLTAPEFQWS